MRCIGGEPPPALGGHTKRSLWLNFYAMSVAFSVNHAVSTTPLLLASSLFGGDLGVTGNSVFFLSALLSSLLLASPLTGQLGVRRALLLGLALYALYAGGFAAALAASDARAERALWIGASVCGGVAGSVAWTAQGGYFATTASMLSTLTGVAREEATASLANSFSIIYLSTEVVAKLGFSVLQGRWTAPPVAALFFAVAAASALAALRLQELVAAQQLSFCDRCLGAVALWRDPILWLLSPTNLAFGFSASLMNGFVNAKFASTELGPHTVGALGSLTAVTAAATAFVLGRTTGAGDRCLVIAFGALCFCGIAMCTTVLGCCVGWGWWITVLYALQGMGRAVYESTNRATFANFFRGEAAEHAFANCALQVNFSKALCYFLQTAITGHRLAFAVGGLAAITPICYCGAEWFRARAATPRWKSLGTELAQPGDS